MRDIDLLAHELALQGAVSAVDCHSLAVRDGRRKWRDMSGSPRFRDLDLRYLEMRGALERHRKRFAAYAVIFHAERNFEIAKYYAILRGHESEMSFGPTGALTCSSAEVKDLKDTIAILRQARKDVLDSLAQDFPEKRWPVLA